MDAPVESKLSIAQRESRRSTFRFGAVAASSLALLGLLPGEHALLRGLLPLAWGAQLLLFGWLVGRGTLRLNVAGAISSLFGLTLFPGLLLAAGATGELLRPGLVVLPMLVVVLSPDDVTAVWTSGVGALAWVVGLDVLGGRSTGQLAIDLLLSIVCFVIALRGLTMQQRFRERERAAALEHVRAEQRLAESETRRAGADRLALVGQLAAGVAHEINNPLAFVASNVNYLEQRAREAGASDEDFDAAVGDVQTGLGRIRQIVVDLSRFSRKEASDEPSLCRAAEAIEEAVRMAGVRTKSIAPVEFVAPKELPEAAIQSRKLVQVLVNLIVNAADALEAAPPGKARWIRLTLAADGPTRQSITVEDDGPGLPEEIVGRVFDPFFTTKPVGKGTGLGLALAREFLEAAGGSIEAANRPGGGARFVLRLPNA